MRFDEASAWYAEFGPFYVGLQFSPSELPKYLEGEVPALSRLRHESGSWRGRRVAGAARRCGGSSARPRRRSRRPPRPTASCAAGAPVAGIPALTARLVASGLRNPLDLQAAPGDRERLYVVEQGGRIRIIRNGQLQPTPFLDVSGRISSGGERGLLGLAFHPQFATNRRFFVNYTNPRGDTHVAEFRAELRRRPADPRQRARAPDRGPALRQPQRRRARLRATTAACCIALGDGGSGGDPLGNGQKLDTLPRQDPADRRGRRRTPYAVPADNPFRATPGAAPEIWAYGLRNPFRFARGPRRPATSTSATWARAAIEEIDVGPRLPPRRRELRLERHSRARSATARRAAATARASRCPSTSTRTPRAARSRAASSTAAAACRISPGRTSSATSARGSCARSASRTARRPTCATGRRACAASTRPRPSGSDADGEVYVVDYDGEVYRLEPAS